MVSVWGLSTTVAYRVAQTTNPEPNILFVAVPARNLREWHLLLYDLLGGTPKHISHKVFLKVVLQKSTPPQIRQRILFITNTSEILHPTPGTGHPEPSYLLLEPFDKDPQPATNNPQPHILDQKSETINPKP